MANQQTDFVFAVSDSGTHLINIKNKKTLKPFIRHYEKVLKEIYSLSYNNKLKKWVLEKRDLVWLKTL
jgi:hypothetical protein